MPGSKAVFLDRDGTLMEEVDYCRRAEDVHVFADVPEALRRLKCAGFLNIIVTNQAGIGRGYFSLEDYQQVHVELLRQIGPGLIDATYFCPDHPDTAGPRRKPGSGMIEEAARDFQIDLKASFLVGDKTSDIECAQNAGLRSVLVETGYGAAQKCRPEHRAESLASGVEWIIAQRAGAHRESARG